MINTVLQGDCLEVLKTLEDGSVDCIITDPPYGIDFQSARRTEKSEWKPKIANDKSPFIWFLPEAYRVLKDGGCILCFTRFDTEEDFRWGMKLAGFAPKQQMIWDKQVHGMGDLKGDVASQHENIIFGVKGRFTFPNKRQKSIWRFQRVDPDKLEHPNEKPLPLLEALVEGFSSEGGVVLDMFAGSGNTLVASKNLNRKYLGIELSEKYVEIINKRLA